MKRCAIVFPLLILLAWCATAMHSTPTSATDTVESLLSKGNAAFDRSEYKAALAAYEQGLALARQDKNKLYTGKFLTSIGNVYSSLGKYPQALEHYQQALAIRREIGDRQGEANDLTNIGIVYKSLGQYPQALERYQQALVIDQEIGDRRGEGAVRGNIGNMHFALGQYPQALKRHQQALAIDQEIGDRRGEGADLTNIGLVYSSLGQYPQALERYQQALAIHREIGDRRGAGADLGNIGLVHFALGQYPQALERHQQALAIDQEIGDRRGEGYDLGNIGLVYSSLGQYPQALERYQQALAIRREIGDRRGAGADLGNIGLVYSSLGQYPQALEHHQQALAIRREIGDRQGEGIDLTNIGVAHATLEEYSRAREHLKQSLDLFRQIGAKALEGAALVCIGDIELAAGDARAARSAYELALPLLDQTGEPERLWRCKDGLAQVQARTGNTTAAIFFGKQAVNTLQSLRRNISSLDTSLQKSFLGNKEGVYRRLADLLMAEGRLSEAEQVLRMLKQEEYFDYTRRDQGAEDPRRITASYNSFERGWAERLDQASEKLAAHGKELEPLERNKLRSPEEEKRFQELKSQVQTEQAAFAAMLDDCSKAFAALARDQYAAIKAERIEDDARTELEGLPGRPALVSYLVLKEGLRILLTAPDKQILRKVDVSSADLNRKIGRFRQALLAPGQDPRPQAKELYDLLIAPIQADLTEIGAGQLTFSLDGSLRYIPMAALHDGTSWLVERYPLSVFTPAGRGRLKPVPAEHWRVAGFGTSRAIEGFAPLPAVPMELRGIVHGKSGTSEGVLDGEVLLNQDFTTKALREAFQSQYPVVHIASHFKFTPGGTENDSYLLLGDGTHLTLGDLRRNNFNLMGVDLLTLSACETAVQSQNADGRELDGLGITAQRRGAKGVLATLWPVADASTAQLMRELYRLRQENHLSKAEALRRAQLEMIQAGGTPGRSDADRGQAVAVAASAPASTPQAAFPGYSHPYYWAPFILMGNWR
ncbi:hypothetical protein JCM15519_16060 [Fundidesulfovibrio butyratiphilus]